MGNGEWEMGIGRGLFDGEAGFDGTAESRVKHPLTSVNLFRLQKLFRYIYNHETLRNISETIC